MSEQMQKQILTALLDKYERSSHFKKKKETAGKITLRFYDNGKCDFSPYDIEQADRRILINQAVDELSKRELLEYTWMRGERNHIIARVWIHTGNLPQIYLAAGREPKGDAIDRVLAEIAGLQGKVRTLWALNYLKDSYDAIARKRSLVSMLPADSTERRLLFSAIAAIDAFTDTEISERVFSLQTFGNSKVFERDVKSRLIHILRKYSENDDDVTDSDLLKQIGIVKYPEQFEFCGDISFACKSGRVNFVHLKKGSTIFSSDLDSGDFCIAPIIKAVITIENRTNYLEYIKRTKSDSELVIYHGGQCSPRKLVFLRMVAEALPDGCKWYHWSDIDYGGFLMLLRLRNEVFPQVMSYRMNISELEKYSNYAAFIKLPYIKKLESLKNYREIADCFDCIDFMVNYRIRLEQEAMLINE